MADDLQELEATGSTWSILRVAIDVLAVRVTRWVAMLMSFGLFAAACWWPDWKRLSAACGFTLLMSLPVWFMRVKGN